MSRTTRRPVPAPSPAARPPRAPLRLVPAPRCEPPFDDAGPDRVTEREAAPAPAAQEALALRFVLRSGVPAQPADVARFDRQPTATVALPAAGAWVTLLVQATVEALAGSRPLAQLRRWTSDEVYAALRRQCATARVHEPGSRPWHGPARPTRARVRAVRVCAPADGVVEACAVVDDGRRARALVLRLEGVDGRWRCTRLDRL